MNLKTDVGGFDAQYSKVILNEHYISAHTHSSMIKPSHLQIPDRPRTTSSALSRHAIDGPGMVDLRRFCV